MTKTLTTLLILILLTSCSSFKQYQGDCKPTKEKFFQDATSLLLSENADILISNVDNGFIKAQKMDSWFGLIKITIQYNTSKITLNIADGTNDSFDDSTKFELYWTIKNGLEGICGTKLVMIKKK